MYKGRLRAVYKPIILQKHPHLGQATRPLSSRERTTGLVLPGLIVSLSTVAQSVASKGGSRIPVRHQSFGAKNKCIRVREQRSDDGKLAREQRRGDDGRAGEQQLADRRREDAAPRPCCGPPPPTDLKRGRESRWRGGAPDLVNYPAALMGEVANPYVAAVARARSSLALVAVVASAAAG
jgi:hypothetical protein